MKKLLLILLLFSLTVSCSKDDNNSKDPFIGTWALQGDDINSDGTWIINSDGTFSLKDGESGNWLNKSSNLNSKNQDYQLAFSACEEVCIQSYSITFSSDFDSGTFSRTYLVDFQIDPYTQGYTITRISD